MTKNVLICDFCGEEMDPRNSVHYLVEFRLMEGKIECEYQRKRQFDFCKDCGRHLLSVIENKLNKKEGIF